MTDDEHVDLMRRRTKAAGVAITRLAVAMKPSPARRVIADQIIRCATSVGSNYRASRRARSRKEFISKLGTVAEEADETLYWLEVAVEVGLLERDQAAPHWREMAEILKVTVATIRSTKTNDGRLETQR